MQGIWETVKERKLGDRGRQGDRETERLKDREERGKGGVREQSVIVFLIKRKLNCDLYTA